MIEKKKQFEEELEEERRRFIEMERKAVGKDISTTVAFISGLFLANFFYNLISEGGDPINRVILLLFLVLPFPTLLIISFWNQKYFFDSAGIKLLLLIISTFEVIMSFTLAYEINGPGTTFPKFDNEGITLLLYGVFDLLLFVLMLLISYFLIQSSEKPIPMKQKEERAVNKS